jgi:flagellar hook protein FlgE
MLFLKYALNASRLCSWFALSHLLAAGCGERRGIAIVSQGGASCQAPEVAGAGAVGGSDAGAEGGPQATAKEIVRFSLSEGQYIAITIDTPGIGLGVVVIRDSNGNVLQTQKHNTSSMEPNSVTGAASISFLWNGCDDDGRPQPTGIYTAEISATDGNPLHLDCAFRPVVATDNVTLRGNLDPSALPVTFDPNNAQTTSNFNTSMTVYNSLGYAIQLDLYFSKDDAANTQPGDLGDWTYHVVTDGANLATEGDGTSAATPGKPTEVAGGVLRFGSCGVLISNVQTLNTFAPKGALKPQPLSFNFGTGAAAGGAGVDGMTQFRATSAVSFVSQDGNSDYIACVASDAGAEAGAIVPVTPDASPTPAAATTGIMIRGNLDETAYPTTFDPDNMQNTTSFNTNTTIYDPLGNAIQIELWFCKNDIASTQTGDSGDWTYHVTTAPQNLASAGGGTSPDLSCRPAQIVSGTLRFDSAGRLVSNITAGSASFVPRGARAPQTISFDFGNGTASGGSGFDGLTQYAATSAISFIGQESM